LHEKLGVHCGPDWGVGFIPRGICDAFAEFVTGGSITSTISASTAKDTSMTDKEEITTSQEITRAWLNYMAMCAGVAAPDTLPEVLRGYIGDKTAPEWLRPTDIVTVPSFDGVDDDDASEPFIRITGTTDVKLGTIQYQNIWKNEQGYQRPVELATVRLKFMVEVLSQFGEYVPDQRFLHLRGGTFLFGLDNEGDNSGDDSIGCGEW